MRTVIWLSSAMLLVSAAPSWARPAGGPPAPCPPDVGAALAAACPCDAASGLAQPWKNHGTYVSCVVKLRNDLRRQGCLDDAAKRTIARCAARSTCGKDGAVLCCVYDTSGTCNDPTPGDGTAAGVCSNDATLACDTDADCVTATGPTLARQAQRCIDRGGTPVGGGSVCGACPPLPPATPTPVPTPF